MEEMDTSNVLMKTFVVLCLPEYRPVLMMNHILNRFSSLASHDTKFQIIKPALLALTAYGSLAYGMQAGRSFDSDSTNGSQTSLNQVPLSSDKNYSFLLQDHENYLAHSTYKITPCLGLKSVKESDCQLFEGLNSRERPPLCRPLEFRVPFSIFKVNKLILPVLLVGESRVADGSGTGPRCGLQMHGLSPGEQDSLGGAQPGRKGLQQPQRTAEHLGQRGRHLQTPHTHGDSNCPRYLDNLAFQGQKARCSGFG